MLSEYKRGGDGVDQSIGLVLIDGDGNQRAEFGVGEGRLVALRSGKENDAAGLVLNQSGNQVALLDGELLGADVANHDHVVLREVFRLFRELLDVVRAITHAQCGVEKETGQLNSGVARQGIPQVAVFPAGERLNHQHLDRLGAA